MKTEKQMKEFRLQQAMCESCIMYAQTFERMAKDGRIGEKKKSYYLSVAKGKREEAQTRLNDLMGWTDWHLKSFLVIDTKIEY